MKLQEVLAALNEAVKKDSYAMTQLLVYRVPVNQDLADHPTIQVTANHEVGILGLINCAVETLTGERIASCWDGNELKGFKKYEPSGLPV